MDIAIISTGIVTFLTPVMLNATSEVATEAALKKIGEKAYNLYSLITNKFQISSDDAEALEEFINSPDNEENQVYFRKRLEKAMRTDEEFATKMANLFAELQPNQGGSNININVSGSGAAAAPGGIAAGEGGVVVKGDVKGDFVMGGRK